MNDQNMIETERVEPTSDDDIRAVFNRLKLDALKLDTSAPLRNVRGDHQGRARPLVVLGAAVTALAVVVGLAVDFGRVGVSVDAVDDRGRDSAASDIGSAFDGKGGADDAGFSLYEVTWVLDSGVSTVEGFPITLTLSSDGASGRSGCNGYGAQLLERPPDGVDQGPIQLGLASATEMGCEPDVMTSEQAFFDLLTSVDSYLLDHSSGSPTLTLTGSQGSLVFSVKPGLDLKSVLDVTWLLDGFSDADGLVAAGNEAGFVRIGRDGSVEGHTGCRALTGSWIEANGEILFNQFGADGSCAPGLARQDNQVVSVLGDGFTPTVTGDGMTAVGSGDEQLVFRRGGDPGVYDGALDFAYDETLSWVVVGVTDDDVLNVRAAPGADQELVGELDASETGIIAGSEAVEIDGSTWRRIHTASIPDGWVNARFVAARPRGSLSTSDWAALEELVDRWIETGQPPDQLQRTRVWVGGIGVYADFAFPVKSVAWSQWDRVVDFTPEELKAVEDQCDECLTKPSEFVGFPPPGREYDLVNDLDLTTGVDDANLGASFMYGPVANLNNMVHLTIDVPASPDIAIDWKRIHLFFDWADGEPAINTIYVWGWTP